MEGECWREKKIKVKGKKRGKKTDERAGAEKGERSGMPITQENKGGWGSCSDKNKTKL